MPVGPTPRNARSEYINGPRIPNALYFDIDDISSSNIGSNNLPHMKPSSKMFAIAMDRMNISSNDTIYVYGTNNCAFYHRTYWTIANNNYHNPSKVKLIQGSLDEWKECGGELEYDTLDEERDERLFRMSELCWEEMTPRYKCWNSNDGIDDGEDTTSVVDMEQVLSIVKQNESDETTTTSNAIIVDARSSGRFYGKDPEPRAGLRGGHMPGAINVPFLSLLDENDVTKFKPMDEVRDIFIHAGIQPLDDDGDDTVPRKVICSCGSGVTAAALAVGLEECGLRKKEDISIYDGSWIDWGGNEDVPIVTDD